jgi:glycosyltransferase involved in cell wall biosynthesis
VAQAAPGGALTREALGLPPDAFVLAHIARLTPVKGHDYVLDAAKRCPDVYFLIAGDGELSEQLARRVQAEGLKNVRLLGFVKDTDSLMNLMDAQINASYGTEATSLALVSGMSLGKPAIATDYGGNPYVIQHEQNGLIVPHKNAEALAQAITRLQTDTALYQGLRSGALSRYEASFTDTEMARQTQDLYRKMLL